MESIRALIVEDDPFAAAQLRLLLQERHRYLQVLATCADGLEGLKAIESLKPELVLRMLKCLISMVWKC
jgi:CheY-like chemotaxis protein